jgi:hypothetical protein
MGHRLQANRKILEGANHHDRDAQFEPVSKTVRDFQPNCQPVMSVDRDKHENMGNHRIAGRECHANVDAPKVKDRDFIEKEPGEAIPYKECVT